MLFRSRVIEDLLTKSPDVIFVEFSVNDDNTEFFQETYEGLIRLIYQSNTKPAIILLHNAFFSDGVSAEEIHSEIGRYYSLPCISLKNSIYENIKNGLYKEKEISSDHLHPNDYGHQLIAETIKRLLDTVYVECEAIERASLFPDKPITRNRYENTICYHNHEMEDIILKGFEKDEEKQVHITDVFKRGWFSYHKGDSLEFDICAKTLAIQYRKTMRSPAPIASVIVDGKIEQATILNAQFDETWGDLLCIENIFVNDIQEKHHIKIELSETYEFEEVPFYIVSIIVS